MGRKALAWLAVFGLVGPAGAQEVMGGAGGNVQEERLPEDLPDNMSDFRRTPLTDDSPVTSESAEEAGVGGSGMAGTGEDVVKPAEQAPAPGKCPEKKQGVEQPEAPKR